MKVEFLYFGSCPHYRHALERLQESLEELSLPDEITSIKINNNEEAARFRFLGLPSIRINGKDIEGDDPPLNDYAVRCRRYKTESGWEGVPSKEMIKAALQQAMA